MPCVESGVGLDDPYGFLPAQDILWFYVSNLPGNQDSTIYGLSFSKRMIVIQIYINLWNHLQPHLSSLRHPFILDVNKHRFPPHFYVLRRDQRGLSCEMLLNVLKWLTFWNTEYLVLEYLPYLVKIVMLGSQEYSYFFNIREKHCYVALKDMSIWEQVKQERKKNTVQNVYFSYDFLKWK